MRLYKRSLSVSVTFTEEPRDDHALVMLFVRATYRRAVHTSLADGDCTSSRSPVHGAATDTFRASAASPAGSPSARFAIPPP